MKFQRVFALVKKEIKVIVREPGMLFIVILFPIVTTLVFGFSFGAIGGEQTVSYKIGLVDTASSRPFPKWSQYFIGNLSGTGILEIQKYPTNQSAQSDLIQGGIQAVIIVPENFGQGCDSFWNAPTNPSLWINATVQLYLDSGSMFATQAIPPIIQQVLVRTVYGVQPTSLSGPIQIGSPSLVQASKLTVFDHWVPGMFAFFAIFMIMTAAESFSFERGKGLLRRINTTPTSPTEFMASKAISYVLIALVQVAIVFVTTFIIGYRPMGDVASFAFALVILSIFSLCCVGFGLIAATVAKSTGAATGIAFIFIMPQMFLGTYISLGMSAAVQAAGKFVPAYYVTDALTSLFLRDAPVSSPTILLDALAVSIYSIAVLLVGILLFRRYGKA